MRHLIAKRHIFFRQNILSIIGISLAFYFGYHLVMGERSYLRYVSLARQIEIVSADFERKHTIRTGLESKVVKLRPGSMEKDVLEERVRYVLGYVHEDERIILTQN